MSKRDLSRRKLCQAAFAATAGFGLAPHGNAKTYADDGVGMGSTRRRILVASKHAAVVETHSGRVQGFVRNEVWTFRGIPYGAATGAAARFLRAQPAPSWTGIRTCLAYGSVCPQRPRSGWAVDESAFLFEWDDGQPSEDCLRLNVWTSAHHDSSTRPVMVWLHGGGFQGGSSQELKAYDGENLARSGGVVVVSVNHRLNVFGHLNLGMYDEHYAESGNVGMLDIVLALRWVRDNIAQFGGNANNVTIFGQSGGGGKVTVLMAMPEAKGLFHKAIVQSGSMNRQATQDASGRLTEQTLALLGIAPAQFMRLHEVSTAALLAAGTAAAATLEPRISPAHRHSRPWWCPVVDGSVLPQHPFDPAAPACSAHVPLLVGTVRDEALSLIAQPELEALSEDEMRRKAIDYFGDRGEAISRAYRQANVRESPFDVLSLITAGTVRRAAMVQASRKAALAQANVYVYWFRWKTPVLDGRPRAFHCIDLPFCFDNVDRCAAMTGGSEEGRALGRQVSEAWLQFARGGDPNHPGLAAWPAFSAARKATMVFDNPSVLLFNPDPEIDLLPEA